MAKFRFCPQCGKPLIEGTRGGRQRKICPNQDCGFVHWDNPVPVVAAVVEWKGCVVLVRSHGWPEKWYGLVTGFLEKNESPEAGVLREVKEELGLEAGLISYIGTYPFFLRNQLILAYHLKAKGEEIVLEKEELEGYKAIPIAKVKPWPSATGIALKDWLVDQGIIPEKPSQA